jgi:hypothetical protein
MDFDWDGNLNADCMNTLFAKNVATKMGLIRCNQSGPSEVQLKMTLPLPLQYMDHFVPTQRGLNSAMESMKCKGQKDFTKKCNFDYGPLEEQEYEMDEQFPGTEMPQFYKSLFESPSEVSTEGEDERSAPYEGLPFPGQHSHFRGRQDIQQSRLGHPGIYDDGRIRGIPDVPPIRSLPSQIIIKEQPSGFSSDESLDIVPLVEQSIHSSSPNDTFPANEPNALGNEYQFESFGNSMRSHSIDPRRKFDRSRNTDRESLHRLPKNHGPSPMASPTSARHGLERIANRNVHTKNIVPESRYSHHDSRYSRQSSVHHTETQSRPDENNLLKKSSFHLDQSQPSFDEGVPSSRLAGPKSQIPDGTRAAQNTNIMNFGHKETNHYQPKKNGAKTARLGSHPNSEWIPAKREQLDLVDQEYPSFDERETPVARTAPSARSPVKRDDIALTRRAITHSNGIPSEVILGSRSNQGQLEDDYSDLTSDGNRSHEYPVIKSIPVTDDKANNSVKRVAVQHNESAGKYATLVKSEINTRGPSCWENEVPQSSDPVDSNVGYQATDHGSEGDELMGKTHKVRIPGSCTGIEFKSDEGDEIMGLSQKMEATEGSIRETERHKDCDEVMTRASRSKTVDHPIKTAGRKEEQDEVISSSSASKAYGGCLRDKKQTTEDELMENSPDPETRSLTIENEVSKATAVEGICEHSKVSVPYPEEKVEKKLTSAKSSLSQSSCSNKRGSNSFEQGHASAYEPDCFETGSQAQVRSSKAETTTIGDVSTPTAAPLTEERSKNTALNASASIGEKLGEPNENEEPAESRREAFQTPSTQESVSTIENTGEKEEPVKPVHEVDEAFHESQGETCDVFEHGRKPLEMQSKDTEDAPPINTSLHQSDVEDLGGIGNVLNGDDQFQKKTIIEECTVPREAPHAAGPGETLECCSSGSEESQKCDNETVEDMDDQTFQSADEHGADRFETELGRSVDYDDDQPTNMTPGNDFQAERQVSRSVGDFISLYTVETFARYCKKLTEWEGDEATLTSSKNQNQPSCEEDSSYAENTVRDGNSVEGSEPSLPSCQEDESAIGLISQIDVESEEVEIRYIGELTTPLATASITEFPLAIAPTSTTLDTPLTTSNTMYTIDTPLESAPTMNTFGTFDRSLLSQSGRFGVVKEGKMACDLHPQRDLSFDRLYHEAQGRQTETHRTRAVAAASALLPMSYHAKARGERNTTSYYHLILHRIMQAFTTVFAVIVAWLRHITGLNSRRKKLNGKRLHCSPKYLNLELDDNETIRNETIQVCAQNFHSAPSMEHCDEVGTAVEYMVPDIHITTDTRGRIPSWNISPSSSLRADEASVVTKAYSKIRKAITRSAGNKISSKQRPSRYEEYDDSRLSH